ncbi:MAG: CRTAC1 family protein [Myxococcota bacterium]|nr:CRTAC1 family protein [Myxococcota bacterium]
MQCHRLTCVLLVVACSKDVGVPMDDAGPGLVTLADRCVQGSNWRPGNPIFAERTEAWGFNALDLRGTRLSVLDFDGDGFEDLFIRRGDGPDDFRAGGDRNRWLLRNREGAGFQDVTEASGILSNRNPDEPWRGRLGSVMAAGDVDNDGDIDLVTLVSLPRDPDNGDRHEVMLNRGDGTFELGPEDSPLRQARTAVPAGLSLTDVDRDGYLDLWITHNMLGSSNSPLRDELWRGDGTGRFFEIGRSLGIDTKDWNRATVADMNAALGNSWAWSSAACDLNGDGIPELLASSYGRRPNHLWLGARDEFGRLLYENHSVASGYAYDLDQDWTTNLSAQCFCADQPAAADCDQVPRPNPQVCDGLRQSFGPNYRWHHPSGREAFNLGGNSGATTCADLDSDGDLDLLTGEIVHADVGSNSDAAEALLNTGEAPLRFQRPGNQETGLYRDHRGTYWDEGIMTNAVIDFDNDGFLDVFLGASDYPNNEGLLYHQHRVGKWRLVGLEDYFDNNRNHGVVVADFDNDGDVDIVVGTSRMRCSGAMGGDCYSPPRTRIFENVLGNENNWIQLDLEGGVHANAAAIGAQVTVRVPGSSQIQEVDGAHGHFNTQSDLSLHFGLGPHCEAEVEIRWPDEELSIQTFKLQAGYRYRIVQDRAPEATIP